MRAARLERITLAALAFAIATSAPDDAPAQPEPRDAAKQVDAKPAGPAPLPALPAARGVQLIELDAAWKWRLVTAPKIPLGIGASIVSAIDVALGTRGEPVAALGDAALPAKWPFDVDGDRRTIGEPAKDERIAAAFGVTKFAIAAGDEALEMLELRLHYQDGIAVWLNGVEVVRQALPRGSTTALATRSHGPEWETFYIPVAPGLLRRGDNTLAVEVHPRRTMPAFAADLVGRRDRGIVRGPILADTQRTSAMIVVETDPNVEVVLEWGTGDASDRKQTSRGRHHRFTLDGLAPSTRYGYRVVAGASRTNRFAFQTLPEANAVMRIGIYGDVRGGHTTHRRLVEQMLAESLDLVAVTGDMVLRGADEADWQKFFAVTTDLLAQVPYMPAIGNHDLGWDGAAGNKPERMFALPPGPPGRPAGAFWYSRAVSDVHLVFLDSNAYDRSEQEVWLDADLAAARKRNVRAILVFTHDGAFSRGSHGPNALARERYVPILARHKIDFLFSGHDHLYQRGESPEGIRYMLAGGGGAPLYGIRCGVEGRPKCKVNDGMQAIAKEHHYAVLTVGKELELCPRRPDGKLLEKCTRYPLRR